MLRWGPPFPLVKTHFSKENHAFRKNCQNPDFLWCSVFSAQARRRQLAKMRVSPCCRGGPLFPWRDNIFVSRKHIFEHKNLDIRQHSNHVIMQPSSRRQPTGQTAFWAAHWPSGQPDASKALGKEILGDLHKVARKFLTILGCFSQKVFVNLRCAHFRPCTKSPGGF